MLFFFPARYQHPNAAKQMATVKVQEEQAPVKYRPPHSRGAAAAEKDLPPGYEPETKTAAKKNQKRRQKKKQAGGAEDAEGDEDEAPTSPQVNTTRDVMLILIFFFIARLQQQIPLARLQPLPLLLPPLLKTLKRS
jgi:hypothetical protein